MTRVQFLNALYQRLEGMSKAEAEEYLTYYAEMLADRMEEGMSEEEAVASMEDTETIARRILQERATGAASVPPAYPDLPPREPMAAPAGKARGSGTRDRLSGRPLGCWRWQWRRRFCGSGLAPGEWRAAPWGRILPPPWRRPL